MASSKKRWAIGVTSAASLLGVAALAATLTLGAGHAKADAPLDDGYGTPTFTTGDSVPAGLRTTRTIPYWSSAFTDPTNGVTYPYTMVGTDPRAGDVSTTIPVTIIPLAITFTNVGPGVVNTTLDGTSKLAAVEASPIFDGSADIGHAADTAAGPAPAQAGVAPSPRVINEPSDVTQVGDAIYRAQWGKSGTGYHVLLGQPTVLPTQSFTVPQNQGIETHGSVSHADLGRVDVNWFSSRLKEILGKLQTDPHSLVLFGTYNIVLYTGNNPANCCIIGYHSAFSPVGLGSGGLDGNGNQPVQTFMFASYTDPKIFRSSFIQDIHALSHEVQEWYDDPFVHNVVNPWLTPTAPQYGCTSALETGDPVVGFGFTVTMPSGAQYHPEDEVNFSWFAREKPSTTSQYYTYLNNFADRAHGC